MDYYIHPKGICESTNIGKDTRIWAYTHILQGARIGKNCNICDHVFIENDVTIGDRVTIKCGVQIWDGITIENDVFIGPNATFTNDFLPKSKVYQENVLKTFICRKVTIGANATILPGISIGLNAVVGAGSVVTHSVPPNAIVMGNPARIKGYVDTQDPALVNSDTINENNEKLVVKPTVLDKVNLYHLPFFEDMRGNLSVGEFPKEIPFTPRRYFLVFDVPSTDVRGEHAHRKCHQFLICVKGSCSVVIDDGKSRGEIMLTNPYTGLYLSPMVWSIQYKYSADAVLLVFASDYYDSTDYIRDYDQFLAELSKD